ncbi:hypothetical protein LOK49_LG13G01537 [Camellia lanceoleosa]|uniref:Uncharacterized protein n=1 Tax=Camellia lanceoleosa TaxID=1840588 RepID=A0ACC0FLC1_9ERIC|nr:hypothetical protein LOK49_LG13G01537 [Camellia lanceoleosa]
MKPEFFRCVDCNFNVHLKCIPKLPETIKYYGHRYRLTITDSMVKDHPDEDEKDPTIEYYCDACEQQRRLFDRTYYCAECHFVSHIDCYCVASEEEALALGEESFVVGQLTGDADDAANHGKTVGEDLNKEGMVVKEEEAARVEKMAIILIMTKDHGMWVADDDLLIRILLPNLFVYSYASSRFEHSTINIHVEPTLGVEDKADTGFPTGISPRT